MGYAPHKVLLDRYIITYWKIFHNYNNRPDGAMVARQIPDESRKYLKAGCSNHSRVRYTCFFFAFAPFLSLGQNLSIHLILATGFSNNHRFNLFRRLM
jgi:hypothetical protein